MPTVPLYHDLALVRHAAHCGEHAAGLRACERLLSRGLPPAIEAEVRAARTWYVPSLDELVPGVVRLRIECEPARPGWALFNPSVLTDRAGGLHVLVRSSNYRIDDAGAYTVPAEDASEAGIWIRTSNLLLRATVEPLAITGDRLPLVGPDWPESDCRITGLEDVRLRWAGEAIVASGTALNVAGMPLASNGWPIARIGTCTLLPAAGCLRDFSCLPEPIEGRYEKNWIPIEGRPGQWLYSAWEAGHVATVEAIDGRWHVEQHAQSPMALRHLRGRSQLVALPWRGDPAWLGIFGEATDDGRRMYDHRFVVFEGPDLRPTQWSRPFWFGPPRGVEFCAGLALLGPHLVASYGLRDEEAWLARMPLEAVEAALEPIPC